MPDRALRKLVNQLARQSAEDIDAVLEKLEPGQRRRVGALLANEERGHQGAAGDGATAVPAMPGPSLDVFSPWLAARIKAALEGNGEGRFSNAGFRLAPAAREALKMEVALISEPAQRRAASPIGRLLGKFGRTQR